MQLIDNMFYFNLIIDYIEIKMMAYDFLGKVVLLALQVRSRNYYNYELCPLLVTG